MRNKIGFTFGFTFFLVGIVLFICTYLGVSFKNEQTPITVKYTAPCNHDAVEYAWSYMECIESLIHSEGFVAKETQCPAGYPTIGFGHQIWPNEHFSTITVPEAYDLLIEDFDCARMNAVDLGYYVPNHQQLAVAHACFCLGMKPVKEVLEKGTFERIKHYIKYKNDQGKYVVSKNLIKAREFEIKLYYSR
jgi:GH24 family phage-related lysozyme (muramidase)